MKRRLEERLLTASIELMLVSVALCLLQRRYMPMGELSDGLRVLAILAATYMHWLSASMTQMSSYYNVSCLWGFLLASNLFVGYHTSWNALTTAINALSFFLLFILSPQNLARRFGLFASFVFLLALPFIVVSFVETSRDRSRSGLEEKLTVSDAFGDSGYFKNDTRLYLLRHDPRSEQIKYALGSGLADILRNTGRILECEFKAHKLRSLATVRVGKMVMYPSIRDIHLSRLDVGKGEISVSGDRLESAAPAYNYERCCAACPLATSIKMCPS